MGEGKRTLQVRMRAEVQEEAWEPPAPVDPPAPEMEQAPTQEELTQWLREAGRGGEVTRVITNPTVGPYGCRGWASHIGQGEVSQKEALTYHGRQDPPEGIPEGWKGEEAPKVPTRDYGPSQDLPFPKEH